MVDSLVSLNASSHPVQRAQSNPILLSLSLRHYRGMRGISRALCRSFRYDWTMFLGRLPDSQGVKHFLAQHTVGKSRVINSSLLL